MSGHTPWREIEKKFRRLRFMVRTGRSDLFPYRYNSGGHGTRRRYVQAFGIRVGYWPCLKAPFVQVALFRWRIEVWYGLLSYGGD